MQNNFYDKTTLLSIMQYLKNFITIFFLSVGTVSAQNTDSLFAVAEGLFAENRLVAAIAHYSDILAKAPDYHKAYLRRGLAHYAYSQYAEAVADFSTYITRRPSDAEAYYNRGVAYYAWGKYEQALEDFSESLRIAPSPQAYTARGVLRAEAGDLQKAEKDYQAALDLNPDFSLAYYNRALLYFALEKWAALAKDLEKLHLLKPQDSEVLLLQARTWQAQKKYKEALLPLNTLLEKQATHIEALLLRAEIYLKLKQRAQACEDWQRAQAAGSLEAEALRKRHCR